MLELIGYGARIAVKHPVQLGRLAPQQAPAPDTAILAAQDGQGQKVLIVPGEEARSGDFELEKLEEGGMAGWVLQQADDGTRVVLGESKNIDDLAEVSAGPAKQGWEFRSDKGYAGSWITGYNLLTTDDETTWPFELVGHDGSMAYVRGPMPPDRVPAAADLAVGDQRLVRDEMDSNSPMVELAYEHGGDEWRLSYHFFELSPQATVAVCCQAQADVAEKAQANAQKFGASLRLAQ
jgi:hypothetical protein